MKKAGTESEGHEDVHSKYARDWDAVHLGPASGELRVAIELEDFGETTALAWMLVCRRLGHGLGWRWYD